MRAIFGKTMEKAMSMLVLLCDKPPEVTYTTYIHVHCTRRANWNPCFGRISGVAISELQL
jgi:hypothetical protein